MCGSRDGSPNPLCPETARRGDEMFRFNAIGAIASRRQYGSIVATRLRRVSDPLTQESQFCSTKTPVTRFGSLIVGYFRLAKMVRLRGLVLATIRDFQKRRIHTVERRVPCGAETQRRRTTDSRTSVFGRRLAIRRCRTTSDSKQPA